MSIVSLIKGTDRRQNILKSLELICDEVKAKVGNKQVVIKPNLVTPSIQLASSHVEQIKGILDFFKGFYKEKIVVAESTCGDTTEAFKNFGYYTLLNEYNVELIDLNRMPYKFVTLKDAHGRPITVRVSELLLDIVELAQLMWPGLSVIDGFVGMEGDGPVFGKAIYVGVAITSLDPLSADRVSCEIMGVEFSKVGYLYYCAERGLGEADINKIKILGASVKECFVPFKLHSFVEEQYRWR